MNVESLVCNGLNTISLTRSVPVPTFNNLLCLTRDDFTRQCGKSGSERVKPFLGQCASEQMVYQQKVDVSSYIISRVWW